MLYAVYRVLAFKNAEAAGSFATKRRHGHIAVDNWSLAASSVIECAVPVHRAEAEVLLRVSKVRGVMPALPVEAENIHFASISHDAAFSTYFEDFRGAPNSRVKSVVAKH